MDAANPQAATPMAPIGQTLIKGSGKPRIVVVGGGFSGAYCAKMIEKMGKDDVEVLVIDRHNYFVFYPLLIEAGTGMLAPTHTVVSIRSFIKKAKFLVAEVVEADFVNKTIRVVPPDGEACEISYAHLVLALGSITKFPPIPGLREYAYEIKSLAQAVALRDRAVQCLEMADATDDEAAMRRLLHFVVVGGSFTGVEVAGEYHDYLREAARRYPRLDEKYVQLTLLDTNKRILSTLPESLSEHAGERLRKRGIDIRLENTVTEVTEYGVRLRTGEWIDCSTVIWAAGIAPPPLIAKLGLPTDRGWLVCEPDGRVKGMKDVWGVGDAAVNPDPNGKGYPATAQHALQEGEDVGRNIVRTFRNQPTKPIVAKSRGTLAPLGSFDAVALVYGVKIKGILAWLLWRGFYLTKVPGIKRSLHLATDWISAMIFGRDFVETGVHRVVRAAQRQAHEEHSPQTVPSKPPITQAQPPATTPEAVGAK